MKKSDFDKLTEWVNVGGGLMPANEMASEILDQCGKGEIITLAEIKARDLNFHKCYFLLLSFIYSYLPKSFKEAVSKDKFYYWLKHLKGEYKVIFAFKDGTKLIEYDSLAFGNMSQKSFEIYIKNQLPWIYENVIGAYFEGDIYNGIIETIEDEFKKFLSKL